MIANNPSLYAYMHSKYANKKENIRVVSIGTGSAKPKPLGFEEISKIDWLLEVGTILTSVD